MKFWQRRAILLFLTDFCRIVLRVGVSAIYQPVNFFKQFFTVLRFCDFIQRLCSLLAQSWVSWISIALKVLTHIPASVRLFIYTFDLGELAICDARASHVSCHVSCHVSLFIGLTNSSLSNLDSCWNFKLCSGRLLLCNLSYAYSWLLFQLLWLNFLYRMSCSIMSFKCGRNLLLTGYRNSKRSFLRAWYSQNLMLIILINRRNDLTTFHCLQKSQRVLLGELILSKVRRWLYFIEG